jgi:LysM repeat protein
VTASTTPAGAEPAPTVSPAIYIEYVIKAGDTLEGLTAQFQTSVDAIMALNPGLSPTALQLGQTIRIPNQPATTLPTPPSPPPPTPTATPVPAPTATPAPAFIEHVVGPGDNLSYIASLYGTTVNTLVAVNGLNVDALLSLGQVIRVPR